MKAAEAESPVWVPVAVIMYTAAVTLATTNEPVMVPLETVQDGDETKLLVPVIEHVESAEAKPDPDTITLVPACAELGFRVMDGIVGVNWKLAVAVSPIGLPVPVIM